MSPADFALDRGEAVQLSIAFSPAVAGDHSESFVVLCDNGASIAHQLSGKGKTLSASELQQSCQKSRTGSLLYASRVLHLLQSTCAIAAECIRDCHDCHTNRPCRDAQDRLLWRDENLACTYLAHHELDSITITIFVVMILSPRHMTST